MPGLKGPHSSPDCARPVLCAARSESFVSRPDASLKRDFIKDSDSQLDWVVALIDAGVARLQTLNIFFCSDFTAADAVRPSMSTGKHQIYLTIPVEVLEGSAEAEATRCCFFVLFFRLETHLYVFYSCDLFFPFRFFPLVHFFSSKTI